MSTYRYLYEYIRIRIHIFICIYICTCTHIDASVQIYMHIHISIYIYIYMKISKMRDSLRYSVIWTVTCTRFLFGLLSLRSIHCPLFVRGSGL